MEGVTDVVFREVITHAGAPDIFFTEFTNVSSFASEKGRKNALERLDLTKSEKQGKVPVVAQIWGKNPDHFSELASALASLGFSGVDINMGCPDKHVNKAGGGAAMIKTPDLAVECIRRAKAATKLPVSAKTRLGFTYLDEYKTWLPTLLAEHPAALTVHLRTRKEMSKVPAHYELIPEIVKLRDQISHETKLIINGDIKNRTHAEELHEKYPGVNGFMIGRGVFQDPYCFASASQQMTSFTLLKHHLDLFDARRAELEAHGSYYAFEPLKHFFKIYINGFPGASDLRAKLMNCKTTAEVRETISAYLSSLSDTPPVSI